MHEFPSEISKLVSSMKAHPYVRERARRSELSLNELSEYGLVCASMIARVAIEYFRIDKKIMEIPSKHNTIINFAHYLAHIIGKQEDATSNEILEQIFGKEFTQCRALGQRVHRVLSSDYSEGWYPRNVTTQDVLNAHQRDQQLISRGAAYLHSEKGHELLQAPITPSAGCPLLGLPKYDGENPFDSLISLFVNYYTHSQDDFILGPASSSLEIIRDSQPSSSHKVFRYDWVIPELPSTHELAE